MGNSNVFVLTEGPGDVTFAWTFSSKCSIETSISSNSGLCAKLTTKVDGGILVSSALTMFSTALLMVLART